MSATDDDALFVFQRRGRQKVCEDIRMFYLIPTLAANDAAPLRYHY
jgi:hypothetical protein